jgi:hypothetical protein
MPRVLPANAIAILGTRSGFAPVNLVDIQTLSGDIYYWSDFAGVYPVRIGAGPTAVYQPWVKSCGPFKLSRSLEVDGGTIVLQNLSGALVRDVSSTFAAKEFVGALVIYRWWSVAIEYALWEFHGYVKSPTADEQQATLPIRQLFDTSQVNALDVYSEQCTWRYKEDRCGSVSAQVLCSKAFGDCAIRNAIERHNGMPFAPPSSAQVPASAFPPNMPTGGGPGGGGGGGGLGRQPQRAAVL